MRFVVALLQIAPHGSDQNQNLAKGLHYCRQSKRLGADLVVFPELWNIGSALSVIDFAGWTNSAIDQNSSFFRAFVALAQELEMSIAITYLQTHHPKPRNSVSIINQRGDVALTYSKVFVCDFGRDKLSRPHEIQESDVGCDLNCSAGESFPVCTLNGRKGEVRVGAMICADREFPEPATQLMLNGAELIVVPNACTWDDIRTAGLRTRAFENLVGVAMVNYPVPRNNGNSRAYTCVPWKNGKAQDTLVAAACEQEQILMANFNLEEVREFRIAESWRMNYRRTINKPWQ